MAALVPLKMASDAGGIFSGILTFLAISGAPIAFCILLLRNRHSLEADEITGRLGALYKGKNVRDKDHQVWYYVILFFGRRFLFAVASVSLFDYPLMQIFAH